MYVGLPPIIVFSRRRDRLVARRAIRRWCNRSLKAEIHRFFVRRRKLLTYVNGMILGSPPKWVLTDQVSYYTLRQRTLNSRKIARIQSFVKLNPLVIFTWKVHTIEHQPSSIRCKLPIGILVNFAEDILETDGPLFPSTSKRHCCRHAFFCL